MKTVSAVIAVVLLFLVTSALAQEASPQPPPGGEAASSASPNPVSFSPVVSPRATPPHRFFDTRNVFAASAFAAGLTGDAWSTQRALTYPGTREGNPLARPFVSSRTGEALYSGSSLGLMLGGMYLAHKTHHHKLERVVPWVMAGWEGFLTGWNLHQISRVR
jgi:hypothetical protein